LTFNRRLPENETLPRHVYRIHTPRLISPRFMAAVKVRGERVYLGIYETPEEASEVAQTYCRTQGLKR
jgi:hypothetical protein